MATSLTATVSASASFTYSTSLTGSFTPSVSTSISYSQALTNGVGTAGTADLIYFSQVAIAGGGNTTVDLVGGSTDVYGNTITMARLKYLLVTLTNDTTATSIALGNATNPVSLFSAATTTHAIRNNGFIALGCSDATGIAMAAGSTDTIKVLNNDGSNTATVRMVFIGSTA